MICDDVVEAAAGWIAVDAVVADCGVVAEATDACSDSRDSAVKPLVPSLSNRDWFGDVDTVVTALCCVTPVVVVWATAALAFDSVR